MEPILETNEYLQYEGSSGTLYKVYKTNPPTLEITYKYSLPGLLAGPQTWQQLKTMITETQNL